MNVPNHIVQEEKPIPEPISRREQATSNRAKAVQMRCDNPELSLTIIAKRFGHQRAWLEKAMRVHRKERIRKTAIAQEIRNKLREELASVDETVVLITAEPEAKP